MIFEGQIGIGETIPPYHNTLQTPYLIPHYLIYVVCFKPLRRQHKQETLFNRLSMRWEKRPSRFAAFRCPAGPEEMRRHKQT